MDVNSYEIIPKRAPIWHFTKRVQTKKRMGKRLKINWSCSPLGNLSLGKKRGRNKGVRSRGEPVHKVQLRKSVKILLFFTLIDMKQSTQAVGTITCKSYNGWDGACDDCNRKRSLFSRWFVLNKITQYLTIIPWARVGYEMVNSQRGAKRRVGYNQSHIQQARME